MSHCVSRFIGFYAAGDLIFTPRAETDAHQRSWSSFKCTLAESEDSCILDCQSKSVEGNTEGTESIVGMSFCGNLSGFSPVLDETLTTFDYRREVSTRISTLRISGLFWCGRAISIHQDKWTTRIGILIHPENLGNKKHRAQAQVESTRS